MKKTLLAVGAACLLAPFASAQLAFVATETNQVVDLSISNTADVHIGLTVGGGANDPADIQSFDLWLQTAIANSGFFSLDPDTDPASPFDTPSGVPVYPDNISVANSDRPADNAQNQFDQGFTTSMANAVSTTGHSVNPIPLETLHITVAPGTPNNTYTFFTTTTSTSDLKFSSVGDSDGASYNVDNPASFSITVVPEPASWLLLTLGTFGTLGLKICRKRRS